VYRIDVINWGKGNLKNLESEKEKKRRREECT